MKNRLAMGYYFNLTINKNLLTNDLEEKTNATYI